MSNKPVLGGINSILRKQREEASGTKPFASPSNDAQIQHEEADLSRNEEYSNRDDTPLPAISAVQVSVNPLRNLKSLQIDESADDSILHSTKLEFHDRLRDLTTIEPISKSPPIFSAKKPGNVAKENSGEHDLKLSSSGTFSLGDQVLKLGLAGNELKLYDFIYRQTIVSNKPSCRVNIKDLQSYLGLTQMSVFRILNRLETKQAIKRKRIEQHRRLIGIELSLIF